MWLGIIGVGKSQLCNLLFKETTNSKFTVGHGNKSQNNFDDLKSKILILEDKFCLIDTTVGDDSKGGDIENLEKLAKFLQEKGKVDCILLVFTVRNEQGDVKKYLKKYLVCLLL